MDVGTVSFRWILPFWYFCFLLAHTCKARLALYAKRKQKYQNGNIHRKLRVPTSEREGKLSNPRGRAARARCMDKIYGNLRKPARDHRAHAVHWFPRGQVHSTGRALRACMHTVALRFFLKNKENICVFIFRSCIEGLTYSGGENWLRCRVSK